jgi:hypothetical protein
MWRGVALGGREWNGIWEECGRVIPLLAATSTMTPMKTMFLLLVLMCLVTGLSLGLPGSGALTAAEVAGSVFCLVAAPLCFLLLPLAVEWFRGVCTRTHDEGRGKDEACAPPTEAGQISGGRDGQMGVMGAVLLMAALLPSCGMPMDLRVMTPEGSVGYSSKSGLSVGWEVRRDK